MTYKELVRYAQLFDKMEKEFAPKNKHWIVLEVGRYNHLYRYRVWRANRAKIPEIE